MPEVIECPVCDVTYELPEIHTTTGLSGIPIPEPGDIELLEHTEAQMRVHVGMHTPEEVAAAFRAADLYIAELEAEIESLKGQRAIAALTGMDYPGETIGSEEVARVGTGVVQTLRRQRLEPVEVSEKNPRGLRFPDGRPVGGRPGPAVPLMDPSQRPAGVVGRKT